MNKKDILRTICSVLIWSEDEDDDEEKGDGKD